jgi:hypothetical protein
MCHMLLSADDSVLRQLAELHVMVIREGMSKYNKKILITHLNKLQHFTNIRCPYTVHLKHA